MSWHPRAMQIVLTSAALEQLVGPMLDTVKDFLHSPKQQHPHMQVAMRTGVQLCISHRNHDID
jgi:hypothetical protein